MQNETADFTFKVLCEMFVFSIFSITRHNIDGSDFHQNHWTEVNQRLQKADYIALFALDNK